MQARRKVNSILHPEIRKRIFLLILRNLFEGKHYVVLDIPLLFEVGCDKFMQKIVVIDCSEKEQLRRLQLRDGIDENTARERINAQMPMSIKRGRATHLVNNDGDRERTIAQITNGISVLSLNVS
ncbi:hypothetical protein AB6A40_005502 [Gnathostoma spinigerum]|uniref:Dephospho-CoA kinase n=1 Tax=Gnathostoma spinigerum TaxID=75299 RepID=A0ABD6EP71_9BILA